MTAFTVYDPATGNTQSLINAITASTSHLNVLPGSVTLVSGATSENLSSVSFYDGSIANLGIGAGLLLTSGDSTPPTSNTSTSYSNSLTPSATDADLAAAVQAGFSSAGDVEDATSLQFQFTTDSAAITGVQFDLIFGSDEYPEFCDTSFVDIAGVFVNGVNYALFGGHTNQPLSIISNNLSAGNFRDNSASVIGIEYDGISTKLTIVAPVTQGTNTIKIAIGDTGDQIYDSGLFVSNLHGVNYSGTGLVLPITGTDGNETITGSDFNEYLQGMDGNDTLYGGLGNDIIDGGSGQDLANMNGNKQDYTITKSNGVFYLTGPDGSDQLLNIENLHFDNQTLNLVKLVNDAGDQGII
ncbi:MAG: choice-of-anchor L domain-containing protein, partial [Burkholderiaceae bacterium]|nr:choice-of-anchor L domain-containing protein [Burkholderiaceae bacterium]